MELEYDATSKVSIWQTARKLRGKTLREATSLPREIVDNPKHKGDLGTLVENYFFLISPGNSPEPDFPLAGLELKTTGVLAAKNRGWRAKERLVLSMIDYNGIVNETWSNSSLLRKCGSLLILFYEYVKERAVIDRRFVLDPKLYDLPNEDIAQIKLDWETIQAKVMSGKAHELSEGDTFYLGACRKGSGRPNELLRSQPFSDIKAKSRAFCFKQGYLDILIQNHAGSLSNLALGETRSVPEATQAKFAPYLGRNIDTLAQLLELKKTLKTDKGYHRRLAEKILGGKSENITELVKAGIELKTIRLDSKGRCREAMSFPSFDFNSIVHEEWEDSEFFSRLERKFLFVVFKAADDGSERLEKVSFWNMPFPDREEARTVWERTRSMVQVDAKILPKSAENPVAHVRPKARNAEDKIPTPQGDTHTRQAFWLNKKYIEQVLATL